MSIARIAAREWLWLLGTITACFTISLGLEWHGFRQAQGSWPSRRDAWFEARRTVDLAKGDSYYESAFSPSDMVATFPVIVGDKTYPPGTRLDDIKASMPPPGSRQASFKDVREAVQRLKLRPEPPTEPAYRTRHAAVRGLGFGAVLYLLTGIIKVTLVSTTLSPS